MYMTAFERGDVLLLYVPVNEEVEMRLRPVLAMHDCNPLDLRVAIVPLTPDPMVGCNSILVPLGSFESARMGLITNAYLNTVEEIHVDRKFIAAIIGRCPYRLLNQFLGMYRTGLGYARPGRLSLTEQAAGVVRQPVLSRRPT